MTIRFIHNLIYKITSLCALLIFTWSFTNCNLKKQENNERQSNIHFKRIKPISNLVKPDTVLRISIGDCKSTRLKSVKNISLTSHTDEGVFVFQQNVHNEKQYKKHLFDNKLKKGIVFKSNSLKGIILPSQTKPEKFGDNYLFTKIASEQNLPGSTVNCFIEDKYNRLWIGTDGGLAIYNGFNFEIYTTENGLAHNYISCIERGTGDTIYVGSKGGVTIFSGFETATITKVNFSEIPTKEIECLKFHNEYLLIGTLKGLAIIKGSKYLILNKKTGLPGEQIKDIETIGIEKVGVATMDGGLQEIMLGSEIKTKNIIETLPINKVKKIDGTIYFGTTNKGLWKLKNDSLYALISSNKEVNELNIFDICKSKDGIALATFGKGIILLQNNNTTSLNKLENLLPAYANCLILNSSNDLLVGGAGGLYKLNNKFNYLNQKNGLASSIPTSVSYDCDGRLWASTINGGLSIFSKNEVLYLNSKNGLSGNNIMQIAHGKSGKTYLATSGKGLDIIKNGIVYNLGKANNLEIINANCVLEDKEENVWIGTNENGLYKWDGKTLLNYGPKQGIKSNSIYGLATDSNRNVLIGTNGDGFLILSEENELSSFNSTNGLDNEVIYSIKSTSRGIFFGSYGGGLYWLKNNNELANISVKDGLCDQSVLSLTIDDKNKLYCGTAKGLSIIEYKSNPLKITNYSTNEDFIYDDFNANAVASFNNSIAWGCHDVVLTTNTGLFNESDNINPYLTSIEFGTKSLAEIANLKSKKLLLSKSDLNETPLVKFVDNNVKFIFGYGGNWFNKQEVDIKFKLKGFDANWIDASAAAKADGYVYNNLEPGAYSFNYCVKQTNNIWSKPYQFKFKIAPPWYRTNVAYSTYALLFIFSLISFARLRNRQLIKKNEQLENIVIERTKEIVEQKEEIEKSKIIVEEQNHELAEKNHEIIQSITYAKRLQEAILPQKALIDKHLQEYFILYLPKDIVAGDFYWFEPFEVDNKNMLFFAAADCTGHGVPGAMVSVVCSSALNRALLEFKITETGKLLDKVRDLVIETFQKSKEEVKDGMDISLCCFDKQSNRLCWSGANNPLWIIRKESKELEVIKPDKQPIGKSENPAPFNTNYIQLFKGDSFYIFTDGYQDQFGGEKGKKFMAAKMKDMFLCNFDKPMEDQKSIVLNAIENWKGKLEQVDDICVWGVRV
jgi:ligand-binding sensor domain-containing protein/serine phosphatase RsbU (regulator of sigma subunit)